jgi:hypothetical protein
MGVTLVRWPDWAERALQGLVFWIGHRHAFYKDYPLPEAALVAEACNLIHANLATSQSLLCEVMYTRLVPIGEWPGGHGKKSRADLVVVTGRAPREDKNLRQRVEAVIEVKRGTAPKAQIDNDLMRLATVKQANPKLRAFLFLVSESKRPKRFVGEGGRAILGIHAIPETNAHYRMRRACKAAAAFSGKETAHYGCIVEVFNGRHS